MCLRTPSTSTSPSTFTSPLFPADPEMSITMVRFGPNHSRITIVPTTKSTIETMAAKIRLVFDMIVTAFNPGQRCARDVVRFIAVDHCKLPIAIGFQAIFNLQWSIFNLPLPWFFRARGIMQHRLLVRHPYARRRRKAGRERQTGRPGCVRGTRAPHLALGVRPPLPGDRRRPPGRGFAARDAPDCLSDADSARRPGQVPALVAPHRPEPGHRRRE